MVAQSPLRHENGLQAIESYHHQTWKRIPDFDSLHHDEINHNSFPPLVSDMKKLTEKTSQGLPVSEWINPGCKSGKIYALISV